MEDRTSIFCRRLENLMEEQDINQIELASRLNVTNSSVSCYILGKSLPRIDVLFDICKIFDVTLDYLFGYSNDKKNVMLGVHQIPIIKNYLPNEENFTPNNIERYFYVAKNKFENIENMFAIVVKKDAMRPRFYEGDIVLIEKTKDVKTGDVIMITIKEEGACLRELVTTPSGWVLNPFTPLTPPTFYSWDEIEKQEVRLIGKVIESVVKF